MNKQPILSIIIPMKNEEEGLQELFARLSPILEQYHDYEIICIDDGSTDKTLEILADYNKKDSRIKAISLSRNFGKEAAMSAGLEVATGDAIIPIDADLQDPPELIPEMVAKWREGYKVVLATRGERDESWFKRNTALSFYAIISSISTVKIPKNTGDFRLIDREVVNAILQMGERTRFMKGIFAWVGYKTTTIYFKRPPRFKGTTKWNYFKLWKLALDGIFSFTTLPLKIWTYIGFIISFFSFIFGSAIIIKTILYGSVVPGYSSLMVVILFLGGIQLMSLGVIGEYIGRIYRETKQRPLYIVQRKIGLD